MDLITATTKDLMTHPIKWPPVHGLAAHTFSELTRHLIKERFKHLTNEQIHQIALKVWKIRKGG